MSINIHLEAVVTSTDNKTRQWHYLVQGCNREHTLQDVLFQHDAEQWDDRHKIMQFWELRREGSPSNKVRSGCHDSELWNNVLLNTISSCRFF
jgi:hypothetical protein